MEINKFFGIFWKNFCRKKNYVWGTYIQPPLLKFRQRVPRCYNLNLNIMTLPELKSQLGVEKLNFYNSTKSSRKVASVGDTVVITTEEFDAKKEIAVYPHPENALIFILSNNLGREPDMIL